MMHSNSKESYNHYSKHELGYYVRNKENFQKVGCEKWGFGKGDRNRQGKTAKDFSQCA